MVRHVGDVFLVKRSWFHDVTLMTAFAAYNNMNKDKAPAKLKVYQHRSMPAHMSTIAAR